MVASDDGLVGRDGLLGRGYAIDVARIQSCNIERWWRLCMASYARSRYLSIYADTAGCVHELRSCKRRRYGQAHLCETLETPSTMFMPAHPIVSRLAIILVGHFFPRVFFIHAGMPFLSPPLGLALLWGLRSADVSSSSSCP